HCSRAHPHPHPFPTRRSSDLATQRERRSPGPGGRSIPVVGICSRGIYRFQECTLRHGRTRIESPGGRRTRQGRQGGGAADERRRSEEHTSELQSRENLVCRLL